MMHFEIYPDKTGLWRWRLKARNGRIIADGGEGYASKRNTQRAVRLVKCKAYSATVGPA